MRAVGCVLKERLCKESSWILREGYCGGDWVGLARDWKREAVYRKKCLREVKSELEGRKLVVGVAERHAGGQIGFDEKGIKGERIGFGRKALRRIKLDSWGKLTEKSARFYEGGRRDERS